LSVFNVSIRRDEAGYYVARCVELPAAMTQGKSEEEAIRNIKEAIHLVLQATRGGESREPKLTVTAVALEA